MVAALRCVRPQFQWYQLAYATEIKSIQLHDSIERLSQKIVSITLHTIHYMCSQKEGPTEFETSRLQFNSIQFNTDICTRQLINYHVGAHDEQIVSRKKVSFQFSFKTVQRKDQGHADALGSAFQAADEAK